MPRVVQNISFHMNDNISSILSARQNISSVLELEYEEQKYHLQHISIHFSISTQLQGSDLF